MEEIQPDIAYSIFVMNQPTTAL